MEIRTITPKHITAYACSLRQEERAAATIEKYIQDIRAFSVWLDGRPVTKERSAQWKEYMFTQNLSPATINAKISAINSLFRYLGWEDCRIKCLKLQRKVFRDASRDLTAEEYRRLLNAASAEGEDWLKLLMETLCSAGIRVSEVKYITIKAVRTGRTDISLKGKIRTIILPEKLCRKLLKYAKQQKIVSGEIFLSKDGNSLSRHQIWRKMKLLCKKAGVERSKVFPHNLRHLFATTFYQATRDIVKLADVLGHSSINTTRIYLLTTGVEHARQMDRLGLVS